MEGYKPPPADLQAKFKPLVRPDEVRGMMGHAESTPDRKFFVLEKRSDGPDRVWELDGYCIQDKVNGRELWTIHMICPKCDRGLTIKAPEKKKIEVTERGLEVEPFRCAWHGTFGSLLCSFHAGIRLPKSQDEALVRCDNDPQHPRKIDGVFVKA